MNEHPLIKATKDFLKAIECAENDVCIGLNVGYHDNAILTAWKALKKETNEIPLLAEEVNNA